MSVVVFLCRSHKHLQQAHAHHPNMPLFFRSFSSSSKRNLHNYYLRKRRKWPLSPYKTKWQETFTQQLAIQTLKQSATKTPTTHLLSSLINSFTTYNCDPTPNSYHFVIKTLIKSSQFNQLYLVLDRLENFEKFETPEFIFVDLIELLGDKNRVQHAIDLFFRIPNFRCTPSVLSLNSLLSVLCKKRKGFQIVPQIILKSKLMNIRIEGSSFRILIKALCRIKRPNYALKLLNYMIDDGFDIDGRVCSLILSTVCEQKDLSCVEVLGFLEEMRNVGFCPGRVDWCNVIRFLVNKGKGMDALDVLNRMKMDGVKPEVVCYAMVLYGIISEGYYAEADNLFDEMLVWGLVPDIYTYNVYIKGLCKQNNVDSGIKMLACMEEIGCKPDLVTYSTLLEELCESGELNKAREVVKRMGLKGVQLNSQIYGIMISGLVNKGEIYEACSLLEKMVGKGVIPQSSTLNDILCGLCQRGLVSKALELLREMAGKNVAPGGRAWEALILGFKYSIDESIWMDLARPFQIDLLRLPE